MANVNVNYTAFSRFLDQHYSDISFLRFRELNIRNLLYYQAELAHLQQDLQEIEKRDAARHTDPKKRGNYRWKPASWSKGLNDAHAPSTPTAMHQNQVLGTSLSAANTPSAIATYSDQYVERMKEIREPLAKYNEAIETYSRQSQLPSPSRTTIRATREWLDRMDFGASFLSGTVEDVWDPQRPTHEFLTFADSGGLSFNLARFWIGVRRNLSLSRAQGRIISVDGSDGGGIAQGISVVVSSLFPVLPIVVLFFIDSLLVRIGVILAFTAVFAAILVFGLKLSAEKVLTITTAIAAVQVVYVGSTANGNG